GQAVVGAAQPRLRELARPHATLTFGRDAGTFHAEDVTVDDGGRQGFTGVHGSTRLALRAGMPGPHGCEP
ncbi:MAG: UDP-N-acetylmuramoyl-tripeptide--D-alanyl-D-alanine ligase, partial [Gammaproteobacteria bacterium]|nr:UDP-N-acetylmuramoyl-tripeptide--D-alanyl-D-alanine ligase [Gammaproteobacteria bacterium]NIR97121.1 UDP-N-acetylmuramoyl-tripeptide--D-alanyl-D-alanine ligase [Gammaproteobacteria bacterium]NIT63116.1 UDP-N-acetylmuramoyl-tripeptide--D-alanyl-D-alanine ligase [Gammaproteobacteria bacterium]NIV20079.1 UDP-N-acetylmuramoyl-tripeptide--D-alanyl-D-alanine ligase [Gammaproteobacteria bacterium]NIY31696.1 UDP-N-acetylmuramoyl-tripeptide--D-alanyl-D-alanine ligase [Gammaproteobacteria bacterium]